MPRDKRKANGAPPNKRPCYEYGAAQLDTATTEVGDGIDSFIAYFAEQTQNDDLRTVTQYFCASCHAKDATRIADEDDMAALYEVLPLWMRRKSFSILPDDAQAKVYLFMAERWLSNRGLSLGDKDLCELPQKFADIQDQKLCKIYELAQQLPLYSLPGSLEPLIKRYADAVQGFTVEDVVQCLINKCAATPAPDKVSAQAHSRSMSNICKSTRSLVKRTCLTERYSMEDQRKILVLRLLAVLIRGGIIPTVPLIHVGVLLLEAEIQGSQPESEALRGVTKDVLTVEEATARLEAIAAKAVAIINHGGRNSDGFFIKYVKFHLRQFTSELIMDCIIKKYSHGELRQHRKQTRLHRSIGLQNLPKGNEFEILSIEDKKRVYNFAMFTRIEYDIVTFNQSVPIGDQLRYMVNQYLKPYLGDATLAQDGAAPRTAMSVASSSSATAVSCALDEDSLESSSDAICVDDEYPFEPVGSIVHDAQHAPLPWQSCWM
jgi:hypothetical protein